MLRHSETIFVGGPLDGTVFALQRVPKAIPADIVYIDPDSPPACHYHYTGRTDADGRSVNVYDPTRLRAGLAASSAPAKVPAVVVRETNQGDGHSDASLPAS